MELIESIEKRSSVRKFSSHPVDVSDLKEMVRLAALAPSINNSQPWKFIAITNPDMLKNMASVVHRKIDEMYPDSSDSDASIKSTIDYFSTVFENAPAVIAVATSSYDAMADKIQNSKISHDEMNAIRNYPDIQSLGACVENMLLSAVDLGYGACWLSGLMIAKEELEKEINIQKPWTLATVVAIGKAEGEIKRKEKKSIDDIFVLYQ